MDIVLAIDFGEAQKRAVRLRTFPVTLGRHKDCQLRAVSTEISRHHCVFEVELEGLRLRDLGSTNGTYVNGVRVDTEGWLLKTDDVITVGPVVLRVESMRAVDPDEDPGSSNGRKKRQHKNTVMSALSEARERVEAEWMLPVGSRPPVPTDAEFEVDSFLPMGDDGAFQVVDAPAHGEGSAEDVTRPGDGDDADGFDFFKTLDVHHDPTADDDSGLPFFDAFEDK